MHRSNPEHWSWNLNPGDVLVDADEPSEWVVAKLLRPWANGIQVHKKENPNVIRNLTLPLAGHWARRWRLAETPTESVEGFKHDAGKLDWTLLPFEALEGAVRVMQSVIDAGKYPRDNWKTLENGEQRYRSGGLRHRFARLAGEQIDPESGLPHIDHEICNLLFERWMIRQKEK
jgi:hypothetical protein